MESSAAVGALAALAQETRLRIFRLLVEVGLDGLPAGEIGKRLDLPLATLSFHLSTLRQSGLIEFRRASRRLIYRANFEVMNALLAYLTEDCCGGRPEVCVVSVGDPIRTTRKKVQEGPGSSREESVAGRRNQR